MTESNPSSRKRICFVTTLSSTLKAFVQPQAEFLLKNGWEITYISAEDSKFKEQLSTIGISHYPVAIKRGIDPLGIPSAIATLYFFFRKNKFDIIQYSTPNAAFYAATAAWLAGTPVRLYAQWGIRYVGFNGIRRYLFKVLERWCCTVSTHIQPDSKSNLKFGINEGLYQAKKGHVIWNGSACGVNLDKFDHSKKELWREHYRRKAQFKEDDFVIGFVGPLRRDKGCRELLEACQMLFQQHPKSRLLLIGDKQFYDDMPNPLRIWADSCPQILHIQHTTQIPQWMSCMDVLTLPSYREGFGTVIIEAEAMGIPVVVSNVPGPIDAMMDGQTGIVAQVRSTASLFEAFNTLLINTKQRLAFGMNGLKFTTERFDQEKLLKHILQNKERLIQCRLTKKP